jgi:hypothetical protein
MSVTAHRPVPTPRARFRPALDFRAWSPATASLVSGVSLVLMVALMMIGYFGGIVPLVIPGDAAATAENVSSSGALFLAGVACIGVVILLDLVVSGAWYTLFRMVNRRISGAAAAIRVLYSVLFAVAASQLVRAYALVEEPDRALQAVESFQSIWLISLGVFGIHLLLIGYLQFRSAFVPTIFGALLAISGTGYLIDALGVAFVDQFAPLYGMVAIVGETAFIFWLLIKGRRLRLH